MFSRFTNRCTGRRIYSLGPENTKRSNKILTFVRGESRIFERGGGPSQARIQDFLKGGGKTFTSTPPLGHCPCDVIHIPRGGTAYKQKRGGSNFEPNVKKPTSWPKRGGRTPWTPPPPWMIRHCYYRDVITSVDVVVTSQTSSFTLETVTRCIIFF